MRWLCFVLGIPTFLLATTLSAFAQEEETRSIPSDGIEVFSHVLNELSLTPITGLRDNRIDAADTVIIVFGQRSQQMLGEIARTTRGLHRFLRDGGSLLVATDHHLDMRGMPITISGLPMLGPQRMSYRGKTDCPLVGIPAPPRGIASLPHPLFRMMQKGIATNCPSDVIGIEPRTPLQPLLEFLATGDIYMVGSPADAPPSGRELYIAGHGMFLNGMMLQTDNDNFALAISAVRWLRESPDGGQRTRALFIVDGEIVSNFDADLSPRLPPLPLPTVRKIDHLLRGIEEEGIIQRLIAETVDMDRTVAVFLALATFVLLVYAAKKFMESRHLLETGVPLSAGPHAVTAGAAVMTQRADESIRKNNLGAEAEAAVRQWFQDHAAIDPKRGTLRVGPAAAQDRTLRSHVERVMLTASGDVSQAQSREGFRALVESLACLTLALHRNEVLLLVDGKEVRQ